VVSNGANMGDGDVFVPGTVLTAVMLTPPTDVVDPHEDEVLADNGLLLQENGKTSDDEESEDSDESDTLSLASSYEVEEDEVAMIAEIQAGVEELIARMKESYPDSSSFLDMYGSSMVSMLEEEKNNFA